MTTKRFTKDEIKDLANNPFTFSVSENMICFTLEFKELFWSYYQSGMQPTAIFTRMGYDPNVLGERRIGNIAHRIRKAISSGQGFDCGVDYAGVRVRRLDYPPRRFDGRQAGNCR